MDSLYTINDSEFDNHLHEHRSGKLHSAESKVRSKIGKYTKVLKKAHAEFLSSGKLFEDNAFPAINANLFENTQEHDLVIDEVKHISWSRPRNIHSQAVFLETKSNR